MGTASKLYQPINNIDRAIEIIGAQFAPHGTRIAREVADIMTQDLHCEALLFSVLVAMINEAEKGSRDLDLAGGDIAPVLLLSALNASGTAKVQTPQLKLVHDVVVELQMAGRNFARLQSYLRGAFGKEMVFYHSCGSAIVPTWKVEAFYDAVAQEQFLRTGLDWSSPSKLITQQELLLGSYRYTQKQYAFVRSIFDATEALVGSTSVRMIA